MADLVLGGIARYAVAASHHATPFMIDEARKFTVALKAKTGASMLLALYDEAQTLRDLYDTEGHHALSFRRGGALQSLYDGEGKKLADYDADGALCAVFHKVDNRAKKIARTDSEGELTAILDAKERLLADLDGEGEIAVVYHVEGDVLTDADEEYAEYLALAEERLALAKLDRAMVDERWAVAKAALTELRAMHEDGREILCCRMPGFASSMAAHEGLHRTAYAVTFADRTLVIATFAESLLGRAFAALLERVEEGSESWQLPEDLSLSFTDRRVATELPEYKTEHGVFEGSYYCGDENYEFCVSGTDLAEYEAYLDELFAMGFMAYDENTVADCRFGTYLAPDAMAGEIAVFVSHFPGRARTQVVYGPRAYLPSTEQASVPENPIPTTFTQPYRMGVYAGNMGNIVRGAPGMSYVAQLADGSYIVIDGGPADCAVVPKVKKKGVWIDQPETQTKDAEYLYQLLCEHAPNGEKPRIAAWFITHPHGDHMALANQFLVAYEGKVEIELAAFNFPDFDTIYCRNERPMNHKGYAVPFRQRVSELYGAKSCVIHTGQRMYFPGCEIEVLYTQEDYYPTSFSWGNHMSCAFRMRFGEKTVMILGDCEKINCQQMSDSYGKALKSDILQLSHHGFNGACLDVNRLVDPDVCLWACDGYRFSTDARASGTVDGYVFNRYLQDKSIKKREHYFCDYTTTLKV